MTTNAFATRSVSDMCRRWSCRSRISTVIRRCVSSLGSRAEMCLCCRGAVSWICRWWCCAAKLLHTSGYRPYIPLMIQRYSRPQMREIWTEQRKLEIWLQIELLASEALCAEGLVPKADFAQMKAKAAFDVERCKELEKTLNHDVIAFTTNVAENIGAPANRWLHFGLTSSDVGDTAFAVQMVQSAAILVEDLKALRAVIGAKAKKHQFTPMIGRSHGIHAEPTTFGLKMALMYDEFARALQRLETARESV